MKKEAETSLTHMTVLLLGPAWREKMPPLCCFLSHISGWGMGKVWQQKDDGEQSMCCTRKGLTLLLSSSKAAVPSDEMEGQSANPPHSAQATLQKIPNSCGCVPIGGTHFYMKCN